MHGDFLVALSIAVSGALTVGRLEDEVGVL